MNVYFAVCATLIVLLLVAIFGALTNILAALYDLTRATRETPILTRPSSYRTQ